MSLPPYPKLRDTGEEWPGQIPDHWISAPIRRVARLESGHTPSRQHPEYWEQCTVPWFSLADIWQIRESGANYIYETSEKVSELGLANSAARVLPKGTVMLSRTASVGFSAIMGVDMATTQDFANWVCGPALLPEFLLQSLRSMQGEFQRLKMGSTHNTIYMPDIQALRIAIPPMNEQKAITAFLARETPKIDALIVEQRRLIQLLVEKRKALVSHAVIKGLNPYARMKPSGVPWLGDVPEHWAVQRISSVSTKITNGYVGPTRDILRDEGVRYLQSLHIKENRILFDSPYFVSEEWSKQHAKSILETGDVLIVQTGDIGQVAVVTDEFAGCNCHALIIVAPVRTVISGEWLSWVLNTDYGFHTLLSIQTGALHPHLNCGEVKDVWVPVPPLDEQGRIVSHLVERIRQFDALTDEAVRSIDLLQERRASLISAAVTGKIDVRRLVETEAA